jgi:hypothetical protein
VGESQGTNDKVDGLVVDRERLEPAPAKIGLRCGTFGRATASIASVVSTPITRWPNSTSLAA